MRPGFLRPSWLLTPQISVVFAVQPLPRGSGRPPERINRSLLPSTVGKERYNRSILPLDGQERAVQPLGFAPGRPGKSGTTARFCPWMARKERYNRSVLPLDGQERAVQPLGFAPGWVKRSGCTARFWLPEGPRGRLIRSEPPPRDVGGRLIRPRRPPGGPRERLNRSPEGVLASRERINRSGPDRGRQAPAGGAVAYCKQVASSLAWPCVEGGLSSLCTKTPRCSEQDGWQSRGKGEKRGVCKAGVHRSRLISSAHDGRSRSFTRLIARSAAGRGASSSLAAGWSQRQARPSLQGHRAGAGLQRRRKAR